MPAYILERGILSLAKEPARKGLQEIGLARLIRTEDQVETLGVKLKALFERTLLVYLSTSNLHGSHFAW